MMKILHELILICDSMCICLDHIENKQFIQYIIQVK